MLRKAGSMGTNRLRSGPDACRTMGLLKEMREEAWRSLCTASALQVGMGQLRFNEVHSKTWSSARAGRQGDMSEGGLWGRRWGGVGGKRSTDGSPRTMRS